MTDEFNLAPALAAQAVVLGQRLAAIQADGRHDQVGSAAHRLLDLASEA